MAVTARQGTRTRAGIVLVALALVLGAAGFPARATPPNPHGWAVWELAPGVHHLLTERPGLVAHAARVQPGAGVALRPVVAFDRVGGGHAAHDGRQPVTDLCARAGGIACVNGDFFNCPTCGQVAGGLVDRGRPLRSFRGDHEQLSIVGGVPSLEPVRWVGSLRGTLRTDTFTLPLASLNRGPVPGAAVLYTPDWGPETPRVAGQVEIVFAAGGPHTSGVRSLVPVARRPVSGAIPRDGIVIAGNGVAAQHLNWIWTAWHRAGAARSLLLDTALSAPADIVVGGHPVLLRDGVRQSLDMNDGLVRGRHPRTLIGWTAAGELLLVTIDGRQPGYSNGATLSEAVDLLLGLGATDAVNLDGGGSTTFALPCATGSCVANRPSQGHQRPVPLALALVPSATPLAKSVRASSASPVPQLSTPLAPAQEPEQTPVAPSPAPSDAPTATSPSPVVIPRAERHVAMQAPLAPASTAAPAMTAPASAEVPMPTAFGAVAAAGFTWLAVLRRLRRRRTPGDALAR